MYKRFIFSFLIMISISLLSYSCKENTSTPTDTKNLVASLVDAADNPVPDALIQAIKGNLPISSDTTDDKGLFELANIPEDLAGVTLLIKSSGFPEFKGELNNLMKSNEFNTGKKFKIMRHDSCKSSISMTVKDSATGNILANVWVKITRDGQTYAKVQTNSEGKIFVNNLCAGKYWYRIAPDGYRVIENYFILGDNDSQTLSVLIPKITQVNCCSQLSVTVVDNENGSAIKDAEVKLVKSGSEQFNKKFTNVDGKVTFGELCEGKYWIRVAKDGYKVKEQDGFVFNKCDTLSTTIKLIKSVPPPDSCFGAFNLTVKDEKTGNPIKDVEVKLTKEGWEGAKKYTDGNGKVSFGQLHSGKYFVRIAKEGYKVLETFFILEKCDTINWEKKLTLLEQKDSCCAGKIIIYPKDETSKSIINGAVVKLWKDGKLLKAITISDSQPAKFLDLCEGKYGVSIIIEGYTSKELQINLGCNKTVEEVVYMSKNQQKDSCCAGKIIIYPKDETSKSIINGAVVKLWKDGKLLKSITISDNQPAKFLDLCEGKYGVSVYANGYKDKGSEINLGCNKVEELVLYMSKNQQDSCCNNKLIVYVKNDSNGQALKNAKVRIWKGGQQITYQVTDENGKVVFDGLCKGAYGVDIIREGYQSVEFQFEVNCGDTKEITKTMKANSPCNTAGLKFFVKDFESGAPISGVKVVIKVNGQVIAEGTTNSDGYYIKENLTAPTTYSITFSKDGYQSQTIDIKVIECKLYGETIKLKK